MHGILLLHRLRRWRLRGLRQRPRIDAADGSRLAGRYRAGHFAWTTPVAAVGETRRIGAASGGPGCDHVNAIARGHERNNPTRESMTCSLVRN